MRKLLISVAAITVAAWSTAASAAVIVSPVAATASSTFPGQPVVRTINHSGLSSGFVSGVTDFDTYLATSPIHSYVGSNEWFSNSGVTKVRLDFDLGGVYTIDRLALWNEDAAGLGRFNVSTSLDNATFTTVATGLVPTNHPYSTDYLADVFSLVTSSARYIRIRGGDCPQPGGSTNEYCAMGEIAFSAIQAPEPATLTIFGLGLAGLGFARRRKAA